METFFVPESEADADSLFWGLRPSLTATCHRLPQSYQILVHCSHWRLDGIGRGKLGHVFMNILAELLVTPVESLPDAVSKSSSLT